MEFFPKNYRASSYIRTTFFLFFCYISPPTTRHCPLGITPIRKMCGLPVWTYSRLTTVAIHLPNPSEVISAGLSTWLFLRMDCGLIRSIKIDKLYAHMARLRFLNSKFVCGAVNGLFVWTRTKVNKIKQMLMKMKSFYYDRK